MNTKHQRFRDMGGTGSKSAILKLPTELVQEVACHLSCDADFCRMIATCSYFAQTVLPSASGVWRRRFLNLYDYPPPVPPLELEFEYKFRRIIFAIGASFSQIEGDKEALWLSCIITMLKETYNRPPRSTEPVKHSRNLQFIEDRARNSNFFHQTAHKPSLRSYYPSSQFLAVQLTMTYFVLRPDMAAREAQVDYHIPEVYASGEIVRQGRVNMWRALHIRNFWRRHLTRPDENSYYQSYMELGTEKMPRPWTTPIATPEPLGSRWLGYYSCLHPFEPSERQTCADGESHWLTVPVMAMKLKHSKDPTIWPALFNARYPLDVAVSVSDRDYFHGVQWVHNAPLPSYYAIRGFTEACPEHAGIPGWTRISFVVFKPLHSPPPYPNFEVDADDGDNSGEGTSVQQHWQPVNWETEFEWVFGYHGIITPGGNIMLGSWLDLLRTIDEDARGPFIYWEVDKL